MTLRNFGGIHQLVVTDASDLSRLDALDAARWAATSAPLRDLHCDPRFLSFVDSEGKGRIRVSHLLAARDWLFARLADQTRLAEKTDELLLSQLDGGEAGQKLVLAARHLIAQLGLPATDRVKLADVRAFRAGYARTLANGDGVVPPQLIPEPEVAAFAQDVLAVCGSALDASGDPGVGEPHLARYLEGGAAFLAWRARPAQDAALLPLGADTEAAHGALQALEGKLEEFFLKCELLRVEGEGGGRLRATDEEWKGLRLRDTPGLTKYLAEAPLAQPTPEAFVALDGPVNPAFQVQWDALVAVLRRVLPGETRLTREGLRRVRAAFAPFLAWRATRPAEPFEKVEDRLAAQLAGPLPARLRHFIGIDAAAAPELAQVVELERLILYQRWLIELANNFVNFSAVYDPEQTALVEMGSMVIDGRRLDFCVKVEDRAAHKKVAAESLIFLVYAQITDQDGKAAAFEVAAPVTAGERGRLRPGKRGIFVDTAGKEWDATIVELAEFPISVKEAALAPFRRLSQFLSSRLEQFIQSQLAASEKTMTDRAAAGADQVSHATVGTAAQVAHGTTPAAAPVPGAAAAPVPVVVRPPTQTAAERQAQSSSNLQGLVLVTSVAFAAIGSAVAYIASIPPLKIAASILGLAAFVAVLSGFLGWLKLRRRDMGLLFEAAGWAINAQMRVTRRIAVVFTRTPDFPEGTQVDRRDLLAGLAEVRALDAARSRQNRRLVLTLAVLLVAAAVALWWRFGRG